MGRRSTVPIMSASGAPGTTTIVVMGVSGSGKSTVAATLVDRLGWEFAEGDDFHPPANVEKMRAGHPLDDEDRWPWLRRLAAWIGEHEKAGRNVVVTCSALKRSYRDLLRDGHPSVWFAHVTADPELIGERLAHRTGHYMPASLLESQLATLEPLEDDEPGARISGAAPPAAVVDELLAVLDAERGLSLTTPEALT
jgi:gluconokinase